MAGVSVSMCSVSEREFHAPLFQVVEHRYLVVLTACMRIFIIMPNAVLRR